MPRISTFALLLGLIGSSSYAQHDAMVELYGEGVHRYFGSDFAGADEILSQVVDSGSLDPRAHYFRGLAREQLGYGGEMDFQSGARLEAEGKRVVDVGSALARIQGCVRTKIEIARRDARIQVKQQQLAAEQARQAMESAAAPPVRTAPPSTAGSTPLPTESIPANDTGLKPPAPIPTPEVGDTADPFRDDAAPATPGATEPATPATDATSPFDAPATDAANPFGDPPAAGDTPATSGNPFDL